MFDPFRISRYILVSLLTLSLIIPQPLLATKEETYRIGREDVLEISVWQSPDLTKMVAVSSKGTISYPFLGDLYVAGQSPQQVQALLTEKLSQGYVKQPRVSVSVKEYNSKKILIFGEVSKPGLYKLKGKIPLLELLFLVGGTTGTAKRMTVIRPARVTEDAIPTEALASSAKARRRSKGDSMAKVIEVNLLALLSKGDLTQNVMIHPGDTIYVSGATGERYYILGQVKKPGPYEWTEEVSVLEAIKLADGATETAALNRIQIRRNLRRGKSEIVKLNVMDIMKGKRKDDVYVRPGDVIIVPESWI